MTSCTTVDCRRLRSTLIAVNLSVRTPCKSEHKSFLTPEALLNLPRSRAFRTGKEVRILVATGVSAHGLDVVGMEYVIKFDLPSSKYGGIDEYIHRIGRTARIGHQGLATSFYNERDGDLAKNLVKVLIECECEVPDFLAHLVPDDGKIE